MSLCALGPTIPWLGLLKCPASRKAIRVVATMTRQRPNAKGGVEIANQKKKKKKTTRGPWSLDKGGGELENGTSPYHTWSGIPTATAKSVLELRGGFLLERHGPMPFSEPIRRDVSARLATQTRRRGPSHPNFATTTFPNVIWTCTCLRGPSKNDVLLILVPT